MSDRDTPTPGSTPRGGPSASDPLVEGQEHDRNMLHRQGYEQATPETEDEHRAVADRTGNALRAEEAAGMPADANSREDAQRAYQQSRGDERERDGRVQ